MNTEQQRELEESPVFFHKLAESAKYALHRSFINGAVFKSCLNCEHFDESKSFCNAFGSNPPPSVIVYSCRTDTYLMKIPF